jgi:acyl carrier protein
VYILDQQLEPVPSGVPGDLYIGGDGLARGYLNAPELTAEKFIPHPFSAESGARLYRSGDRARYTEEGVIEFLGRADNQVKIRGYRIELGEIEEALSNYPNVRECAVLAFGASAEDKRLVAYVVSDSAEHVDAEELYKSLKQRLPSYMVPARFVALDKLPLTENGKVDRRALKEPEDWRDVQQTYVAPRNEIEERLATIFAEVLDVEKVGIHDSFFRLGGHSLIAIKLRSRIRDGFNVELPIATIFSSPTVAELSEAIEKAQKNITGPVAPAMVSVPRVARRPGNSLGEEV